MPRSSIAVARTSAAGAAPNVSVRPAKPRTLPIDSAQNPTASAPQGALPDPYANPR